jgi:hypothetical protein
LEWRLKNLNTIDVNLQDGNPCLGLRETKFVQKRLDLMHWQIPLLVTEMHQRRHRGVSPLSAIKGVEENLLALFYRATHVHLVAPGIAIEIEVSLSAPILPREDINFETFDAWLAKTGVAFRARMSSTFTELFKIAFSNLVVTIWAGDTFVQTGSLFTMRISCRVEDKEKLSAWK